MAKRKKDRTDELLAELVKGKSPEEILGEGGILKQLTKRLVENALEGEMTEHLGYEPHAAEGREIFLSRSAANASAARMSSRSRSGKSRRISSSLIPDASDSRMS